MMRGAGFQFDPSQQYQLDAIGSVVDLFDGQPKDAEKLLTTLRGPVAVPTTSDNRLDIDLTQEIGAFGNSLVLDRDLILTNLQRVQDRNGLEVSSELASDGLDFDIEMETGTGKTYVYLRTLFELAARYNFTKFVILVPSVAIREGVSTSIRLMRSHFENLYKPQGVTFDASVYSGKSPEEVQSFATSTNVQILIMTIDSIRGNDTRVIRQSLNRLNGFRPIDYLAATRPVVIMDEPQNMETKLAQSAIGDMNPICTLRYSATHKKQRNVVYRLDPVDAHKLGLVKQVVVADVRQEGADVSPHIKLLEVNGPGKWAAKLELSVQRSDGTLQRKPVRVKPHQELARVTNNSAYEGLRIIEMRLDPPAIELTRHGELQLGESIGEQADAIYREMIRQTIREHLRKEVLLRGTGIKVLSLFFIDRVANFIGDGSNNVDANGKFVQWFDDLYVEERARLKNSEQISPHDPAQVRRGYFAVLKGKRGAADKFKESSGTSQADDDAYALIMQDKTRLLDETEPTRFIFSYSALREGWDNPNVFQICTLREMGVETERRQTLGRGLRLPVRQTPNGYERVSDRSIATLTVIANESYTRFAGELQREYKKSGVEVGVVRRSEFSRLPMVDSNGQATDETLGFSKSLELWEHLRKQGITEQDGTVTNKFRPNEMGFTLNLPVDFVALEVPIIERIAEASLEKHIRPISKRQSRKLNKQLYSTPEFEEFWETIASKTTYRVRVDRDELIANAVKAIREAPTIEPLQIKITRTGVTMGRGGAKGRELGERSAELRGTYALPDIITELQEATSLTRKTIVDILLKCDKLHQFIGNPNDFIAMVKRILKTELAKIVVDGIQYEKIKGYVYELRELQQDGAAEKDRFLDQMYKVENEQKTDFDYVVYDSTVEREFAELLDSREDIKLFMKLPPKFKIDTPVGPYNPDWAIIKQEDGEDKIYMIRETKSTLDDSKLRPSELAKIKAAKKHFEAIGVGDYRRAVPDNWGI